MEVGCNAWVFWPHTLCMLAGIGLMGAALALAGALPLLGWVVAGLAVTGALTGLFVMHDWPPFELHHCAGAGDWTASVS